jgi:hypothetical protein
MTRLQTGKRPRLRLRLTTMRVWPGRGLGFWASVLRHMKTRGLDPKDLAAVRRVCGELDRGRPAPQRRGPQGNTKRRGGE